MMQRHIPFGYRMENGKIYEDKEKVTVVRMIFTDYLSGISTYKMAMRLTEMNFLNANSKPSWNHVTIGKILENTKYLGDEFYPRVIENEIFMRVQSRRVSQCNTLGRQVQINSMKNKSIFSGMLRCGECGEVFRKYVEHCGKPAEKSNWKCKQYIHKNKGHCICGVITDRQIEEAFLNALRKIIQDPRILERNMKESPYRYSIENRKLDQQITELEAEQRFGQELAQLIYQRAVTAYQTAEIKGYDFQTDIIKKALKEREIKTFDEDLFQTIVKIIHIFEDGRIHTEFINGTTIHGFYESRKRG